MMEIKTGNEIYLEGCDVREQSKKRNYDDFSSKERKKQHNKKWVAVDDMIEEWIRKGKELCILIDALERFEIALKEAKQ